MRQWNGGIIETVFLFLPCRRMTTADRDDLVPAPQEKLEWVTPKISLMEAEDTEGKSIQNAKEFKVNTVRWSFLSDTSNPAIPPKLIPHRVCKDLFIASISHLYSQTPPE